MKKAISLLLSFLLIVCIPLNTIAIDDLTNFGASERSNPVGDLNEDGVTDVADILKLKNLIMNDAWTDDNLSYGDLNDDNTLDVADIIKLKYIIMYAPQADPTTYTRGEWITLLAEKIGIESIQIEEDFECFYGDSLDSEYGSIAETFHALNLLPAPDSEGYVDPEQDIPLFEADKTSTREFAAYTVAKVMGFEGEYAIDCVDSDQITYMNEVAVVVQQGFFVLNAQNSFEPMIALIGTDKNRIFAKIDEINSSLEISEADFKDEVTVRSEVMEFEDMDYSAELNDNGTYTAIIENNDSTAEITDGSIIILPANDSYINGITFQVQSVSEIGDELTLICTVPALEDVIEDFDFAGNATADIANLTLADGVTAKYDPNGTIVSGDDSELSPFDVGDEYENLFPGTLTFDLVKQEIEDTGITVSGSFEFEIPKVTAKAKGKLLGGLSIDELTFSITNSIKLKGEAEYDLGIPESSFDVTTGNAKFGTGKTELGRLPIKLGASGLSLDFVFFANFDVSGTISISYTIENTNGFQYKDGAFRIIKDFGSECESIKINAGAKIGLGLAARISLFSVFDLAGVDFHAGLGLNAKFVAHEDIDPDLYCGDAAVFLYATLELDEDTIIIDLVKNVFGLSWKWEIFTEDNSPLKLSCHIENGQWVDSCTYGKGHILGAVKDAETGEAIGGARIMIYNASTNTLVASVQTQHVSLILSDLQLYKGEFLAQNLPAGSYKLDVKATGYQAYSIMVDVLEGQRVVCEAALMLLREDVDGNGTVSGTITNALTGELLSGTNYLIRADWNSTSGDVLNEGLIDGSAYTVELAPGNYTIEIAKEGFISVYSNFVVQSNSETTKNIAISPIEGIGVDADSFRVVLTWGTVPEDLDSHLYHKDSDGYTVFHTCYYDDYYGYDPLIANLDVDDIDGEGPETSTVYEKSDSGTYSFYVHDYTNLYSDSSVAMSNSGAQVKLYSGEILLATFNIPQNREGTLWHVFDYDATTDEFTYVNEFSYATEG